MAFGADSVRRIRFIFEGDTSDLNADMRSAGATGTSSARGVGRFSGALALVGPAAAGAATAAAGMAARWALEGVSMAETAEVVAESFDTTFGDAAEGLAADMEATRLAMGLSESQFHSMSTTLGQTATAMGMSREEAAEFSAQLITASGDVAAFNGDVGASDEVLGAMTAALRSEFDPLERFGVAIKQADVNTKALNDTGKESEDQLTAQEKAAATLALILENLEDETGSLADSTDTAAGKQAAFNAQMADAQAEVGAALLPLKEVLYDVLLELVPVLEDLMPLFRLLAWLTGIWAGTMSDLARAGMTGYHAFKWIEGAVRDFQGSLRSLWDSVSNVIANLRNLFSLSPPSWLSSVGGWIGRRFHSGGRVPGSTGSQQPAMLQGGETVLTASQTKRMERQSPAGGGIVINIQAGVGDPMEIGRQVADVLGEYSRQTGGVDIDIRQGA